MATLQDEIDAQNLWDLDAQVDIAMEALRCPADDAKVDTLSGGEKRRVALCKLLLEAPDMLLQYPSSQVSQSITTFPEFPEIMAAKPCSKLSIEMRCVMRPERSSPPCTRAIILYQVSNISRP